jgi:hypothetical protein
MYSFGDRMLKPDEVYGNQAQEVLIMLLANVFEKYCKEDSHIEDDYIDILTNARKTIMNVFDVPVKDIWDLPSNERKKFVLGAIDDMIKHYSFEDKRESIVSSCLSLYANWKKEYRKNNK